MTVRDAQADSAVHRHVKLVQVHRRSRCGPGTRSVGCHYGPHHLPAAAGRHIRSPAALKASTSCSPRPLSVSGSRSWQTGRSVLASQTSIRTFRRSQDSHKPTGGTPHTARPGNRAMARSRATAGIWRARGRPGHQPFGAVLGASMHVISEANGAARCVWALARASSRWPGSHGGTRRWCTNI